MEKGNACILTINGGSSSLKFALGGLDTLVFAGGIGENAPEVRARVCDGLGFLGVELDETRNAQSAALISPDTGRVAVHVIHTDEEYMIAKLVGRLLGFGPVSEERNTDHPPDSEAIRARSK